MPDQRPDQRPDVRLLTGWGRTTATAARVVAPTAASDLEDLLTRADRRGVVARGLGRSYGDAAQNAGGTVVDVTHLADVVDLDLARGVVRVAAGTSFDALMRILVPLGYFVPVTPGTRYVTVGGAIAADIHGKNHHLDGSLAEHLESFVLHTPAGTFTVSPEHDPELFWGTTGGMGLTGIVSEATIRLLPIETSLVRVDTDRYGDLDAVMEAMVEGDARYRYSVAWVDCLARGRSLGRSVLTRGDHAPTEAITDRRRHRPLDFTPRSFVSAPTWVPNRVLNPWTARAFNEAWFRKAPKHATGELQSFSAFFHPLDGVRNWNRLYGTRGFLQYQLVVPDAASDTVRATIERLAAARCPSFLAVLKRFGPGTPGPLSFPRSGWTLALDIPASAREVGDLLDQLDRLVADAGGRVYLAKDARLLPDVVATMYPELDRFRELRSRVDPSNVLQSDLARRLGLVDTPGNAKGFPQPGR